MAHTLATTEKIQNLKKPLQIYFTNQRRRQLGKNKRRVGVTPIPQLRFSNFLEASRNLYNGK